MPREIYVRRRVAALVILLVVIALLIWGLTAAFGGKGGDQAEGTNATDTAATAELTTPASDAPDTGAPVTESAPATDTAAAASESDKADKTENTESTSAAKPSPYEDADKKKDSKDKKSCKLEDLKITASSDESTYKQGQQPTFYMTVDNPTSSDCKIDLDKDELRFEVYDLSTNKRVWSDTDCYPSVLTGEEKFEAGKKRHFEAVWSRMGSAPEQCRDRKPAPAGGYFLHTVIGNNPSPALTFNLR